MVHYNFAVNFYVILNILFKLYSDKQRETWGLLNDIKPTFLPTLPFPLLALALLNVSHCVQNYNALHSVKAGLSLFSSLRETFHRLTGWND